MGNARIPEWRNHEEFQRQVTISWMRGKAIAVLIRSLITWRWIDFVISEAELIQYNTTGTITECRLGIRVFRPYTKTPVEGSQ